MTQVAIVDYGVGNVASIVNALEAMQCQPLLTDQADQLMQAERLIIPGVGAFGYCAGQLREAGLWQLIGDFAQTGKPLLGICVGMQLLFDVSEEHGEHAGLGLMAGRVVALPVAKSETVRLPHIGWNPLVLPDPGLLPQGLSLQQLEQYFYFVHGYGCYPDDTTQVVAMTDYGGTKIPAMVKQGNVVGTQFHPERSGPAGLALLQWFANSRGFAETT